MYAYLFGEGGEEVIRKDALHTKQELEFLLIKSSCLCCTLLIEFNAKDQLCDYKIQLQPNREAENSE